MPYTLDYLEKHSNLPGARSNLELLYKFAVEATAQEIEACLAISERVIRDTPSEFIYSCGVAASIVMAAKHKKTVGIDFSNYATHESWRVRESVCIGFQKSQCYLSAHQMLRDLAPLKTGSAFEKRAYVATLCEPALLKNYIDARIILEDLYHVTVTSLGHNEKLSDEEMVLKKALGYCWSVAIAGDILSGKVYFEFLLAHKNYKHIRWILCENLKKKRLEKLDPLWVDALKLNLTERS